MGDARLRELARRRAEGGTAADEAAYLRAALRAGELTPARLRVAAACGDEAARAVLGVPVCRCNSPASEAGVHHRRCPLHPRSRAETPDALAAPRALRPWVAALARLDSAAGVRAAIAATRADLSSRAVDGTEGHWHDVARLELALRGGEVPSSPEDAAEAAIHAAGALMGGEPAVRDAICGELLPWATGRSDPLDVFVRGEPAGPVWTCARDGARETLLGERYAPEATPALVGAWCRVCEAGSLYGLQPARAWLRAARFARHGGGYVLTETLVDGLPPDLAAFLAGLPLP